MSVVSVLIICALIAILVPALVKMSNHLPPHA